MSKRAAVPEGKSLFFRPPEEPKLLSKKKEPTRQSAIFLEEQHLDWLDDKCREARRNGGRAIRKAAIIRALLDVAIQAGVDLTSLRREEELVERIRKALQQPG
ncbi:MAG: hypothetical protein M1136_05300 [Chloroflexi bacterium]|nr:hypothetical protein [Chloroflexota bacterium]MCL5075053.1 hypothetical protein [Chloroflexota bacterium]